MSRFGRTERLSSDTWAPRRRRESRWIARDGVVRIKNKTAVEQRRTNKRMVKTEQAPKALAVDRVSLRLPADVLTLEVSVNT